MTTSFSRILAAAAVFCLASGTAFAQGTRGTITGTVLGPTGQPQGNVTLVVTNAAGVDRRAVTEPTGEFVFGGLAPGTYRLRVDDETFAPWSQDQIVVGPGERKTIPVALQPRVAPQATRGTIAGTVFGPDGRPRGDITVIITTPAGIDRRAVSEPTGAYLFGGLQAGIYKVRIETPDPDALPFAIDNLVLAAGERRLVDLRLQPKPVPPVINREAKSGGGDQRVIESERKKKEKKVKTKISDVPEVTATDGSFEVKHDRWQFDWPKYERYSPPQGMPWVVSGGPFDPYNQNTAKADRPIGGDKFLNLNLQFNNNLNPRHVTNANNGVVQDQLFYNQNLVAGIELFKGDTVFQPKAWAVRATAVLNINANAAGSFSFGDIKRAFDPKKTDDPKYALEEAFVEKRLTVIDRAFDFVSVRAGMQNFNSDFRGFVFQDNQLGVRLFGNARSNRDQYNVAYFAMRDRDGFSQLHDILGNRDQDVIIANYYIQDLGAQGYTGMFNVHVNRDRAGLAGVSNPGALNATYVGFHGDGRIGSWSIDHALYGVFGHDDFNRITKGPIDINAQMAAVELSHDADWKRYRGSFFYASGDDGSDPTKGKGFDSITDNPNFAGGQFMYWTQQATNVGGLLISQKFSLLPNLRDKFAQRSNFVNPGLMLVNGGVDLRVSPQIKVVTNVSYLRFATVALLRTLRPGAAGFEDDQIGIDYSAGAKIRPFTNENLFLLTGFSILQPRGGFATALAASPTTAADRLYSMFVAFQVAY